MRRFWSRLPAGLRALVLGMISALALPPVHLVPVLLLSIPLLLRLTGDTISWKRALLLGFLFGMGLYTTSLYWLTDAVLVRAAELWWAVPLASPATAVPLSCFVAFTCVAARLAPAGWRRIVLFASVWTLTDLARQFVLTGFPWNPWGSVWEFPGLAGDVMIQSAAWISVHGLTLLTLLMAATPLLGRRGMLAGAMLLAVWIAAGSVRLAFGPRPGADNPLVVLVQGNVSEEDKISIAASRRRAVSIFRSYVDLTGRGVAAAAARRTALGEASRPIVFAWPESAFPGLVVEDRMARVVLMQAAPEAAAGLIGSVRYGTDERPRNSLVALMPDGQVVGIYDKAHLVPLGEYQPAGLPIQLVPGGGFVAGPGPRTLHLPGLAPIGPLICYEVIFPGQVLRRADRPAWLLNVTNDAWYGNTAGPRQHLDTARMRAVEEGLPLARAANTGISAAFDAKGRLLGRLGWNRQGTVVVALPGPLPPTLFAQLGLPVPFVMSLMLALIALARRPNLV